MLSLDYRLNRDWDRFAEEILENKVQGRSQSDFFWCHFLDKQVHLGVFHVPRKFKFSKQDKPIAFVQALLYERVYKGYIFISSGFIWINTLIEVRAIADSRYANQISLEVCKKAVKNLGDQVFWCFLVVCGLESIHLRLRWFGSSLDFRRLIDNHASEDCLGQEFKTVGESSFKIKFVFGILSDLFCILIFSPN